MPLFSKKPAPEPIIVNPPPSKKISQPVQAILSALENRPHTFVIKRRTLSTSNMAASYTFTDRVTGLTMTVCRVNYGHRSQLSFSNPPFELTGDEKRALLYAGQTLAETRIARLTKIKGLRQRRQQTQARAQWCAAYHVKPVKE